MKRQRFLTMGSVTINRFEHRQASRLRYSPRRPTAAFIGTMSFRPATRMGCVHAGPPPLHLPTRIVPQGKLEVQLKGIKRQIISSLQASPRDKANHLIENANSRMV